MCNIFNFLILRLAQTTHSRTSWCSLADVLTILLALNRTHPLIVVFEVAGVANLIVCAFGVPIEGIWYIRLSIQLTPSRLRELHTR